MSPFVPVLTDQHLASVADFARSGCSLGYDDAKQNQRNAKPEVCFHLVVWQATTGVTCGGLGLRTALGVALPAFTTTVMETMSIPWHENA